MSFIWFEAESSLWLGMWMDSGRAEVLLGQAWTIGIKSKQSFRSGWKSSS